LRRDVRAYDVVARYGGDEFAIVAIDADEDRAMEVAQRAIEGIAGAVAGLDSAEAAGRATAGVAEWRPGETPTHLIARADATLLHGKQGGARGVAIPASALPDDVDPIGAQRAVPPVLDAAEGGVPRDLVREQTERLRLRTRQLALANDLGTRVAAMTDPREILEAAVEELNEAFGWYLCAILRIDNEGYLESVAVRGGAVRRLPDSPWSQPLATGLIGRAVTERRPVVSGDVHAEPDYRVVAELADVRSELAVPLWVGEDLWGVIDVEDVRADAFDEDDARLLQTVADQVGSALRSATLYQQLDSAYVGTAEALSAALEARDSRAAARSNAVVENVRAVGLRLGLDERTLRTLRLGAIFHDIGKVGVPQALLEKRGELTPAELDTVQRHAVLGERILAPIEFLEDVRELVRHEHERWDGGGYPDGLAGEEIPLGSRIILACDAYDAMLTDRPYRAALSPARARVELERCADTQFDPRVVAELLAELDERAELDALVQPAVSESR
jgi:GAF domain-containing protein